MRSGGWVGGWVGGEGRQPGAKLRAQLVVCFLLLRDDSSRERHCALDLRFNFERHVEALEVRRILTSRQYLYFIPVKQVN